MNTRPYASCLADALALCGVPDANAIEVARVKLFLNLACRRAHSESDYWPRWLVTEERVCSEDGLVPYSESGKSDIDVCRRIHATEPFAQCGALEYPSFVARADGIQIAGYVAREVSDNRAPMRVSGTVFPNLDGVYSYTGESSLAVDGETTTPNYQSDSNEANTITASITFTAGTPPTLLGYRWRIKGLSATDNWRSASGGDYATYLTPDLASGNYEAQGAASDDGVTVEKITTYSAWITYKAAFSVTYGDGESDTSEVPAEWADYAVYAAYAHFLRNDGQQEKAAIEDAFAYSTYLVPQLEKLDNQSGGHVHSRVINHANSQWR